MFLWPVPGPVTRGFDYLSNIYVGGQHAAIDIAAPSGTPIRAIADGIVAGIGWDFYSGFFVALRHAGGWRSFYRHLYGQTPVVVSQGVAQSQIIGNVGNTGYSLGPHLHFDLWNIDKQDSTAFGKHGIWAHDPELYLGQEDDMTDEEYKMLQTVHHFAKISGPETLRDIQAKAKARYDELVKQNASLARRLDDLNGSHNH